MSVVLHVVYSGLGGTASVFFSLAEASADDGYEHAVAFYGIEALVPDYRERCERLGLAHRFFRRRPRFDPSVNERLYRWMEELCPHAIVVHLPRALGPAVRYRRRHPTTRVIGVEHHPNALKRPVDWIDSARFAHHCDRVVYLTAVYRQEVAERLGRFHAPEKSAIIPNGISTDTFSPADAAADHSTDSPAGRASALPGSDAAVALRVGMCSRLSAGKDILTLLQAVELARRSRAAAELSLTLAGDGPQRAELEEEGRRLGLGDAIRFEGFLTEAALAAWFRSVDIYAHATLSETMSTAVMQALASGLPCVASDVVGMDELVPDTVGIRVPSGDAPALAAALVALAADAERRGRLGHAARAYVREHLSRERAWEGYKALIEGHDVTAA